MTVCADGSFYEQKINSSFAIENSLIYKKNYYFFSRQADKHYKVSENGIEFLNLLDDDFKDSFCGVFSAISSDNYKIGLVNCGTADNGYLMKLVLEADKKKTFDFYDKILCNAIHYNNSIILNYIDLASNPYDEYSIGQSKLAIFNVDNKELYPMIDLPSIFRSEPDFNITCIDDCVFLFGNNTEHSISSLNKSYLGKFSILSQKLDTITIEGKTITQIFAHNSNLIVIYDSGEIDIYDQNLRIKGSFHTGITGKIRSTYYYDNCLHIAWFDESNNIFISSYDLISCEKIKTIAIPKPKSIDWHFENFSFLPIINS